MLNLLLLIILPFIFLFILAVWLYSGQTQSGYCYRIGAHFDKTDNIVKFSIIELYVLGDSIMFKTDSETRLLRDNVSVANLSDEHDKIAEAFKHPVIDLDNFPHIFNYKK